MGKKKGIMEFFFWERYMEEKIWGFEDITERDRERGIEKERELRY
jgi:hypothetical protein